jgi:hypothetical protein
MIITPFYWTLLHSKMYPKIKDFEPRRITYLLDHTVPFIAIVSEWMLSTTVFHLRLAFPISFVFMIYFCINFSYSLAVKPIYPILDYRTPRSYIIACLVVVALASLFYLVEYLTLKKLKYS